MKALAWLVAGPLASVLLGYAVFFALVFVLGPGIDIDDHGTTAEKFSASLAFPALYALAGGGTFLSVWMAVANFRRARRFPS